MAFEVTEKNAAALMPLFKPWEEPVQHRLPNAERGQPAIIQPGRRPSKCPLVRSIRAEVDGWRRGGYAGVSETSRTLLNYWFNTEHLVTNDDGETTQFRYHWAQREAIETIIYLYEMRGIHSVAELILEFGDSSIADLALGINPEEDRWPRRR
jgi:type III restriction enzyme